MPRWAYPRGGMCVGGCFLTGEAAGHRPDASRTRRCTSGSGERYGFLMPLLYLLAGRDPLRNRFEIEAGLEDGNYVPRQRARGRGAPTA